MRELLRSRLLYVLLAVNFGLVPISLGWVQPAFLTTSPASAQVAGGCDFEVDPECEDEDEPPVGVSCCRPLLDGGAYCCIDCCTFEDADEKCDFEEDCVF